MSEIAIRIEGLCKEYTIGTAGVPYSTLREVVMQKLTAPFKCLTTRSTTARRKTEKIWALKDVSFEIKQGEVVGLIGRNGAGKSTLLKILSRIMDPTQGRAELYGRTGSLLEVGTGFHPELTGRENIYLNGALLGMKRTEITRKFDEIVAFSEVEKFIDTPVKRYSSGMYVRLAFAVAAHLNSEILLVDEVLAVGDAAFQKKCLGKMGEVAKGGRTVLFVSHNMFSLQDLCTQGLLLESGKILLKGEINDVIHKYLQGLNRENGEIAWPSVDVAPGTDKIRLKAVRVVSDFEVPGKVDIKRDFKIEVDYWNLEENAKWHVSIHLSNSMGVLVLSGGNHPCATKKIDPWADRPQPLGVYSASCTIPGGILNDGQYSVTVYINGATVHDFIHVSRDVLSFEIHDTGYMREGYGGPWLGVLRMPLDWKTVRLETE